MTTSTQWRPDSKTWIEIWRRLGSSTEPNQRERKRVERREVHPSERGVNGDDTDMGPKGDGVADRASDACHPRDRPSQPDCSATNSSTC